MFFDKEKILDATNQGYDIICRLYPDAIRIQGKKNKHFKARDERTASATMRIKNGVWHMTDHGEDQKERSAIDQWMHERNCTFQEALEQIAAEFQIDGEGNFKPAEPEIRSVQATADMKEGEYSFEMREGEPTDKELDTLFATMIRKSVKRQKLVETMAKLRCYPLISYSMVKNRKVITIRATDDFPIFLFEPTDKLKKIYKPKEQDKKFRFVYYGEKEKDMVFNLSTVQTAYDNHNKDAEYNEADQKVEEKLPEVIICSGESDSLNVAAMGYQVVWMNSETADLTNRMYNSLAKLAEKVMYLGDIDPTGKRRSYELGMQHMKLHIIKLPDTLLEKKDWRKNACKDVRDYLKFWGPWDFKKLVATALYYQFYDEVPVMKGDQFLKMSYKPRNTRMYNFLSANGYNRLATESNKDGFKFIHLDGNIVKEQKPSNVKDYLNSFLEEQGANDDLRDTFYRCNQLGDASLANLPYVKCDFRNHDPDAQYLFFKKCTWKVHANGIEVLRPHEVNRHVWEEKVLPYNVKPMEDFWKISYERETDSHRLEILNQDCILLQYLERTARMHWRVTEKGITEIDGHGNEHIRTELTAEEQREQEAHLINRLYTLGYLMHRHKEKSKAWAVWALENKITDADESKGGSGKSIFMAIPGYFMKMVEIPARDPNHFDNKHWNENVDEYTDYVHFDDANRYMKFDILYPNITGQWTINPKNTKSFILPYREAPKMGFSSNFPPYKVNQSTERRLLYTVFSDYYHHGPNDEFESERNPNSEFGLDLFDNFNEEQWNLAINTVAQCIKLYLSSKGKINPPMDNVTRRQLKNAMGDAFHAWADAYFDEESGMRNKKIKRSKLQDDFYMEMKMKWSAQRFKQALDAWCKYYQFTLNPVELCNSQGRIIEKVDDKTEEMFYVHDGNVDLTEDEPFF